jgi:molybdopterin-guanine dinucleotide biosynthesis protein A
MLSAAILAGGKAARFHGVDKGALVVDGRPIFERQLAEVSQLTADIMLVGGRASHERVRALQDRIPGCGPLGGLHAALTGAHGEVVLVLACDMPYITAPLLAYLAELTRDGDAVVPRTDRGWHPLCAAYTRRCLAPVARRLGHGHLKLIDLLDDLRVRPVSPEELDRFGDHDHLVANLNTPAEYDDVAALQRHGR